MTGTSTMPFEVEQCDREAAADLLDEISALLDHNGIGQVADLIRDGEYDDHESTIAFARHRHEARQQAIEEAARVAADWCVTNEARGAKDTAYSSHMIATAIRSLSTIKDPAGVGEDTDAIR